MQTPATSARKRGRRRKQSKPERDRERNAAPIKQPSSSPTPKPTTCRRGSRNYPKPRPASLREPSQPPPLLLCWLLGFAFLFFFSPYIPWSKRLGRLQRFCTGCAQKKIPRHDFVCKMQKTLALLCNARTPQRSHERTWSHLQEPGGRCQKAQQRCAVRAARAAGREEGVLLCGGE